MLVFRGVCPYNCSVCPWKCCPLAFMHLCLNCSYFVLEHILKQPCYTTSVLHSLQRLRKPVFISPWMGHMATGFTLDINRVVRAQNLLDSHHEITNLRKNTLPETDIKSPLKSRWLLVGRWNLSRWPIFRSHVLGRACFFPLGPPRVSKFRQLDRVKTPPVRWQAGTHWHAAVGSSPSKERISLGEDAVRLLLHEPCRCQWSPYHVWQRDYQQMYLTLLGVL